MRWLVVALGLAQCLHFALTAKILALCLVASRSHSLWCYRYMAILAERGHEITVFGVDKPKIKIPKLKTFIAEGTYESFERSKDFDRVWASIDPHSKFGTMYLHQFWSETSSEAIMQSQGLKDLINEYRDIEKPFDLIIHDSGNVDAILGLVPLFGNPPLVEATTFGVPQWMVHRAGNIFNPSYVPNMISEFGSDMTFWQRCVNTFYYFYIEWFITTKFEPFQERLKERVFGKNLPHVKDIAKRANIIIVNHSPVINEPRPFLPGVIGIVGLHIAPPQPLPKDLQDFMDGAEHGVILISFGTNVESTWFAPDFESQILKAFEGLPERVVWKWDKTPAKVPANVKVSKWLPQGDMLAHPKLKLFISHCGLLSMQEAIFRKTPILALPIFMDQFENAELLERRNLSKIVNYKEMTSEVLRHGIKEILTNPMYKTNIERLGALVQDAPLTTAQQAVYWTEYAMRHNGAAHLRSAAADIPWHQLLLLDVLGVVAVAAFVCLWLLKTLLAMVVRRLLCKVKRKYD